MFTVRKSSVFSVSVEEVFARLQKLKTLQYIAYPYATFEAVNGEEELIWKKDNVFSFRFKIFGLIPFGIYEKGKPHKALYRGNDWTDCGVLLLCRLLSFGSNDERRI